MWPSRGATFLTVGDMRAVNSAGVGKSFAISCPELPTQNTSHAGSERSKIALPNAADKARYSRRVGCERSSTALMHAAVSSTYVVTHVRCSPGTKSTLTCGATAFQSAMACSR